MAEVADTILADAENVVKIEAPPEALETAMDGEEPAAEDQEEPENASETLYIQNLNDKVKLPYVKTTLTNLFRHYGKVLDVVAHRSVRMRGQAFVSFASVDVARKALKETQRFPLYGKPMQISYAKTRSEAVVKSLVPEEFDEFHALRLKRKKRSRWDNPVRRKLRLKKEALATGAQPEAPAPTTKRPVVLMPDEYLPPNQILFVQNLPIDITKETLVAMFSRYENFYEVRMIPTKKDIAFVEYADEASATVAKDALHNFKLDGEAKIKVTYARK